MHASVFPSYVPLIKHNSIMYNYERLHLELE